ncbi:DUF3025 domain-containing protein [Noviherbaspirillum suwonense]|uniref:Transmembrane protein n=1 Tax=Noviherbaspirillum suwonense TaxID=1224511 RepID=A0ABY1QEG0_9BURK|nr:DUF3025 domain-containing protein [Noviherbaspirillum suwonense]SMP69115.1 Protein of unknown function [Noviherbaspirillum suwonense]
MSDAFLAQIDWRQPWLAPVKPIAERVLQFSPWQDGLNALASDLDLRNHRSLPLCFVPQADLPAGVAYETFISESGGVPTRANLHDFFNALVWLTYPRIKVALNAMQAKEIEQRRHAPAVTRGRTRDAATIFDENAVLLLSSSPAIGDMLRQHAWRPLFIEQRELLLQECRIQLFGHALMEKLVKPYKAITGHTWVVTAAPAVLDLPASEMRAWLDATVAMQLQDGLNTSHFTHLPVLGVPGWWPMQDEAFYADAAVFRPLR